MTGKRHSIPTEALLEIGDINGLLHEVNGQATGDGSPFLSVEKEQGEEKPPAIEDVKQPESKPKPPDKKTVDKPKKEKPKPQKPVDIPPEPKDEWERTLKMMNDYSHTIDRKTDKSVFIEGEAIEVLRSCFGYRTTRLVNVIVRKFIEGNKDRLKAMQSKQWKLLK